MLHRGDRVSVSPKHSPEIVYYGSVDLIDFALVNRAAKTGPFMNYVYISLDVPSQIELMRGSPVIVKNRGICVIESLRSETWIDVFCDDGGYNIHNHVFTIPRSDIQSILCSHKAFDIQPL
jgi:hypothetical protein